jgi:hypothetical protein
MPRQKEAAMAAYRFYFLDEDNHIQVSEQHDLEHDAQAIDYGETILSSHGSHAMEIRQGTRLVHRQNQPDWTS